MWAIFREFDLAHMWLESVESAHVLHRFGEESELYHLKNSPIVKLLSPTEDFQDRNYVDSLDEHGCLCLVAISTPVDATTYKGVGLPTTVGRKRVSFGVFNMVTPLSKTRTRLTLHMKIQTPFLFLPSW